MNHIELWRLAADILLLLSLGYLSFQFVRSPRLAAASRQMRDLEAALRTLIKEADGAGRTLNDQLLRRQQSLEKLLLEADILEQRMAAAAEPAPRQRPAPEVRPEVTPSAPRTTPAVSVERVREKASQRHPIHIPEDEALEPRSFVNTEASESAQQEESEITFGSTNIYGEPIETQAAAPAPKAGKALKRAMETYTPLSAKIEKEVKASPSKKSAKASVEDIYASAEELLRAGNDLNSVSARTKLPIEEVRALSQMIIGERAVATTEAGSRIVTAEDGDPRMDVLTGMKRTTVTL